MAPAMGRPEAPWPRIPQKPARRCLRRADVTLEDTEYQILKRRRASLISRAAAILRALGLPHADLEPVEGFSKAVWLTPDHAVHHHLVGAVGRLEHEARVAERLPPEALFPPVVGVGRDGGHDWMVTRRVAGVPLPAAWPALTPRERRSAVHQAAAALRHVHHAPATDLIPPALQGDAPVISRQALAERARSLGLPVPAGLLAAGGPPLVMAHGDFNLNQLVWRDGRITALLDLEMSHAEAPDWEVVPFLGFCRDPVGSVAETLEAVTRPEDYRDAPAWLREAYPQLFAHPDLRERLAWQELVFRGPEVLADPRRWTEIVDGAMASAGQLVALLA